MQTVLVNNFARNNFVAFLSSQKCSQYKRSFIIKKINGTANPFETLRTLDQFPVKIAEVKSGHSKSRK